MPELNEPQPAVERDCLRFGGGSHELRELREPLHVHLWRKGPRLLAVRTEKRGGVPASPCTVLALAGPRIAPCTVMPSPRATAHPTRTPHSVRQAAALPQAQTVSGTATTSVHGHGERERRALGAAGAEAGSSVVASGNNMCLLISQDDVEERD